MDSDFSLFLKEFVSTKHPYEPKLCAICVGGGASLSLIQTIPGSSRLMGGIYLPYDNAVVATMLSDELGDEASKRYHEKSVQKKVAEDFASIAMRKSPDGTGIGITAALTTNRFRKGDTHAFISFASNDWRVRTTYHLRLSKLPEEHHKDANLSGLSVVRATEDETIARLAISIVYGFGNDLFYEFEKNGLITEV
jgi:hypothetical protein